ncbi:MAG TPA: caspase family protein [Rhodocyclaceae bacterium]|nr:caspase family protein [Rhodocyclaceae bacterium]
MFPGRTLKACLALLLAWQGHALAQSFPMIGNMMPGMAQFQAVELQRHQARTLLYREALEELRKNPKAADVADCPPGVAPSPGLNCIPRGEAKAEAKPAAAPAVGRHLAVLIGNNDYGKPIPALETPVGDVEKIAETLQRQFGFRASVIKNAKKADIVRELNRIAAEARPEDSVLIMYAGHGYLMDDTKAGYWIPVDGSTKSAANWISNSDIVKFLQAIPVRQMMLVSDSCFSGSLTREQKISEGVHLPREEILRRRAVLVLSSGGEEPVSDEGREGHSIFAWGLIKTLAETRGDTTGFDVYRQVKDIVTESYPQEPQYGAALAAGHMGGGEYLFERR